MIRSSATRPYSTARKITNVDESPEGRTVGGQRTSTLRDPSTFRGFLLEFAARSFCNLPHFGGTLQ